MRLIRSFPHIVDAGRNYIVDDAQRIYNSGWDYAALADIDDDIIHLDWDQAISREDLATFADEARQEPERVLVGPTKLYRYDPLGIFIEGVWNCGFDIEDASRFRRVVEGEAECEWFGFGLVYLPRKIIAEFIDTGIKFQDVHFSPWHYRHYGLARVSWKIDVIHLHYRISEVVR